MQRSHELEIMDRPDLPEDVMVTVHKELTRVNRLLGNTAALVNAVRRDPKPVGRVLDLGCGHGGVLLSMRSRLRVEVVGVDLRVPARDDGSFPILRANAVSDPLPEADVAVSSLLLHHLPENDVVRLIQNAGRTCRRLVLLDLVRSRLSLMLFQSFLAPFLAPWNASDGANSSNVVLEGVHSGRDCMGAGTGPVPRSDDWRPTFRSLPQERRTKSTNFR